MAKRKGGLGRSLDTLLSSSATTKIISGEVGPEDRLQSLSIELIQRSRFQPRTRFDQEELESLAASIRAKGIIQPIVVRPIDTNKFEIIAGERRWRAAQLADLHQIPAVVRQAEDGDAMAMALIENIQRQDLNPIDEANALHRLLDEFEMTHKQVAEAVGRSAPQSPTCYDYAHCYPKSPKWWNLGSWKWVTPVRCLARQMTNSYPWPEKSPKLDSPFDRPRPWLKNPCVVTRKCLPLAASEPIPTLTSWSETSPGDSVPKSNSDNLARAAASW